MRKRREGRRRKEGWREELATLLKAGEEEGCSGGGLTDESERARASFF
jgi:hypothetical protein